MATKVKDFVIEQGKTFQQVVRWEVLPIIYRPITAVSLTAPVSITCPSHGIPPGWRAAAVSVKGTTEVNALSSPPKNTDYHVATVVDPDTVEFNDVNAAGYTPYVSGGYLQFNSPKDLSGYTARMSIRDKIGGSELLHLVSPTDIVVDNSTKTITVTISAVVTAGFAWAKGVYDLEMVSGSGEVFSLLSGKISIKKEVTIT